MEIVARGDPQTASGAGSFSGGMASQIHRGKAAPVTNKRQSSCLTAKAQSRIGKNTLQIAQDLLVKKLGELSPVKQNFKGPDIESFSQFFDRPINKEKMETFQVLVDHGGKKPNNGGHPKKQVPAQEMA
jgi:hypothetical protein